MDEMGSIRWRWAREPLVLALLVVALALRLGWAGIASDELYFDHVFTDATARGILDGRGFTVSNDEPYDPAVFRTPGYSAFLAGVYAVGGGSVRSAFFVNALLDTLSCLILYLLVRRRLGASPARWALFVAATYPFTIYAVGTLSPESLLLLLGLLFTGVVDSWPSWRARGGVIAAGILAAALVWVKPICLPVPVFLVLAERLRGRPWRTGLVRGAVVFLIMGALFAPWVVRNVREFEKPILAAEVGLVLWHGTYDFEDVRDEMVAKRFEESDRAPEEGLTRYEKTRRAFADSRALIEKDAEFRDRAFARMRERPWRAVLFDPLRRVPRLWVSTTFTGGPAWIGIGAAIGCIGYLLLGAGGLFTLRGRWGELAAWWVLPALLTLAYAVFHVEARYTLPARPVLWILGGVLLSVWFGGRRFVGAVQAG